MFTKMITLIVICGDYCVNAFDLRQERLEKYIYSFEKNIALVLKKIIMGI